MTEEIRIVLQLIIVIMCLATVFIHGVVKYWSPSNFEELRLRVRTWWIMISIFMLAVLLGPVVSIVFFAILSFLALREYLSLVPVRYVDRPILMWLYLTIPIQYLLIASNNYEMFVIFVPVVAFVFVSTRMVLVGEMVGFIGAISTLNWGLMLTVYMLGHIGFLLVITAEGSLSASNSGLVLFLVLLTELNDVAQYVFGKLFGRTKAIIKASPKKTMEGLVGGLLTTVLAASLISPWLTPLSFWESLGAGILIGFGGFLGDITFSAVKRDLGIKDSGKLLPGHGGILDRVDSLFFTAPLFFHYIYQLKLY